MSRGIPELASKRFGLGFVAEPRPGHEMYRGMVAIPYLRPTHGPGPLVASIRFRCIEQGCEHHGHGKYNTMAGDSPRMYNTAALLEPVDEVAITEGEFDALTATNLGLPAVGIPGVQLWKPQFRSPFLGFQTVYVFADGDEPGMRFANELVSKLSNAKVIPCPPGHDVSSLVHEQGADALLERIGR